MRPGSTGEVVYGVVCWYVNPTLGIEETGGKEKKETSFSRVQMPAGELSWIPIPRAEDCRTSTHRRRI